jgi:hypothetical protein
MMFGRVMQKAVFFVIAAAATGLAGAQQARPNPGDPKAPVPAFEYRSVFESYRRHAEPEVSGWREMNEEVRRIGGHVGIVREQPHPTKPVAKPPADAAHGGNK